MSKETDFIVTIHALERMEKRFPEIALRMTDQKLGSFIHEEVMDALDNGRRGKMPPLEMAPSGHKRWLSARKNSYVTWNEDKTRGYVLQESDEGLLVLTVLVGRDRSLKRQLLLGGWKK